MQVPGFQQAPPRLGNQYLEDSALRELLQRIVPEEYLKQWEGELTRLGWRVVEELPTYGKNVRDNQPHLVQYNAWGRRIDALPIGEGWFRLKDVSAEEGIVGQGYDRKYKEWSRVLQYVKLYLFGPYSAVFTCPLAMTDGAARLIEVLTQSKKLNSNTAAELKECYSHLISRDPATLWTSGQWMTERTGGSDVGNTETIATRNGVTDGNPNHYLLYGYKFFTSATHSEVAFTLARIQDENGKTVPGSRGLSLFYIKVRDEKGELNNIKIHRLKDKLGTETLPTAELELVGTHALLVGEIGKGIPEISSMFNITRLWVAVGSAAVMRKAIAIARDYAHRRRAFGKPLTEHPLHLRTLANQEVMYRGCLQFAFFLAVLQGKVDVGAASKQETDLIRLLTPLGKLYTAPHSSRVVLECMECLGGAGYMEDATDLPAMLRTNIVNHIWEGTTNVLSLDLLRALGKSPLAVKTYADYITSIITSPHVSGVALREAAEKIKEALSKIQHLLSILFNGPTTHFSESVARQLAFAMSATFIAALLMQQAMWPGNGEVGDSETFTDTFVVTLWTRLYLFEVRLDDVINDLAKGKDTNILKGVRRVALDVDRATDLPRGMGDICPYTGKMRASY